MTEIIEDKESAKVGNRRVHMANERTFLAWIRTSNGIRFCCRKVCLVHETAKEFILHLAKMNFHQLSICCAFMRRLT